MCSAPYGKTRVLLSFPLEEKTSDRSIGYVKLIDRTNTGKALDKMARHMDMANPYFISLSVIVQAGYCVWSNVRFIDVLCLDNTDKCRRRIEHKATMTL